MRYGTKSEVEESTLPILFAIEQTKMLACNLYLSDFCHKRICYVLEEFYLKKSLTLSLHIVRKDKGQIPNFVFAGCGGHICCRVWPSDLQHLMFCRLDTVFPTSSARDLEDSFIKRHL